MIKILHTADWHLGQVFHEYDRTYEHHQFLDWLVRKLTCCSSVEMYLTCLTIGLEAGKLFANVGFFTFLLKFRKFIAIGAVVSGRFVK